MKKFLALTLALVLCLGVFVGCQPKEVWEQTVFSFGENETAYKYYGRVGQSEKGVEIAWPASGVEFSLKCSGDVTMKYNATRDAIMHISVDGQEPVRPKIKQGIGKTFTLAEGLPEGEHTFQVLLDNDINGGGGTIFYRELEFYGVKDSMKPTADRELFIEFVGDSITSGHGVMQKGVVYDAVDPATSPVNGYAFRTAALLNADWSLVSKGGCGYYRLDVGCGKTGLELYPYVNGFALKPVEYTPARKADIVVLGLGHNDAPDMYTEAQMEAAVKEMIGKVYAMHGEDTPIVLLTGMMSNYRWHTLFAQIAEELDNVYFTSVPRNNDGGRGHPYLDGSIETADILSTYIRDNVLPTLQK